MVEHAGWSPQQLKTWRAAVLEPLGRGMAVTNHAFDLIYPPALRELSPVHFTPVRVALNAAALVAPSAKARVLDVGCGAGKFCIIGAASTGATFVGVEQREWLAALCQSLVREVGIAGVQFSHGDVLVDVDWSSFDGFYLYNPFMENVLPEGDQIDLQLERTPQRLAASVAAAVEQLSRARVGSRVVTYHGFGGVLPSGFHLREVRDVGTTSNLELWVKQARPRRGPHKPPPLLLTVDNTVSDLDNFRS